MRNRRMLTAVMAVVIAMQVIAVGAQRPGHGDGSPSASPATSSTPVAAVNCSDVETYYDHLDATLATDGPFMDFFFSEADYEALTREEGQDIVEDGEEIVSSLNRTEVPAPYQPAHDGITLFMQGVVDFVTFYTVDSSTVPNLMYYEDAMTLIYEGEVAIAEACPQQIEEIGGYVFFDPATLEDEFGPDE